MAYPIDKKLVVGISSSALFDLRKEDKIFREEGLEAYRKYHVENKFTKLEKGVGFPFIKRFLSINDIYTDEQPVEVVLLSKNSPETGIRAFNSIREYNLNITRAAFITGGSAVKYIPAFNISLFLTKNEKDVKMAIDAGMPAGRILETEVEDDDSLELRIAFDFDGVLVDNEAERIYKEQGIEAFREYEKEHSEQTMNPGLLNDFFKKISAFQKLENEKERKISGYKKILKTSIITARNAPAHERAINTLNSWEVEVDEMFLLGGIEKWRVLEIARPHLYIDDQRDHLDTSKLKNIPLVHVPFGITF